jgi:predicted ATPase
LTTYVSKKEGYDLAKSHGDLGYASVDSLDLNRSILSQRDDPERFPNISHLANKFRDILIYRDWDLGIDSKIRQYQRTDEYPDFLLEDASNLNLVLNDLYEGTSTSYLFYEYLPRFSLSFEGMTPSVRGGGIMYYVHENGLGRPIPFTRLSTGFLRFLCLLAILCHPNPPSIVCIEEPEICMHPDVLPLIAELLKGASQRTQLFVTTHSDILVSALSDTPENVIVCNRSKSGTYLKRIDKEQLKEWLVKYSLGDLWRIGEIGGLT